MTGGAATPLYDEIGRTYAQTRRSDPRIARQIRAALGDADSVINIGAGSGSYEPEDLQVVGVEPSMTMIRQRLPERGPSVRGTAEAIPFPTASFDASLAILTLHHWTDWRAGIREMVRVARKRTVMLTWETLEPPFWLVGRYFPAFLERDRQRFPPLADVAEALGGAEIQRVMIPADCQDGFLGAFWNRPEQYLDPRVRAGISSFEKVLPSDPRLARLAGDLRSGLWDRELGSLRGMKEIDLGYRLLVATH